MSDASLVYAYLAPRSTPLAKERAWMLVLDRRGYLVYEGEIGRGTEDEVEIDLSWSLRCVLEQGPGETPFCVLAHNHPSGNAWPSVADAQLTRDMKAAARREGVECLDHVVLGRGQCFSFAFERIFYVRG
jgi:DNA repair protein RadC